MEDISDITMGSEYNDDHHHQATATAYYEYEDGEEIKQIWNPIFVVFAYVVAIISSYAAVHLLDHGLWFWRSEELKNVAIIKYPHIYAACILGLGTVWGMHFVSKV